MAGLNWTCTSCGQSVTLSHHDFARGELSLSTDTGFAAGAGFQFEHVLRRCPNPECQKSDLDVIVRWSKMTKSPNGGRIHEATNEPVGVGHFKFLPVSPAPLSAHAPAVVVEDYQEAYLIRSLSPKASAALARRALQGMIRDFHQVVRDTLHQEIEAIRERCDADLYDAMMAVKSIGNIGAHPERDVALIVEIELGEPEQLLELIHELDLAWYVARASRAARVARVTQLAEGKAGQKAAAKAKTGDANG